MRRIEFIVEEPSTEEVLRNLLPRLIGGRAIYRIHAHNGYNALIERLPQRLEGYRRLIREGNDIKVVVLVDEDRVEGGCYVRKRVLEDVADRCGLLSKTVAGQNQEFYVVNRLAVEELEAWYFGDLHALRAAFPNVNVRIHNRAAYQNPDAVTGGTAERLLAELQRAGYYPNIEFLPKIDVARKISEHMSWQRNNSRSFNVFRQGVTAVLV